MSEIKEKKVLIKQIRVHQKGFRLGRHVVLAGIAQEFMLNEKEQKELKSSGPSSWIKEVSVKEMKAMPKSNKENKAIQDAKKK